jgi:hypothetical protein
MINLTSPRTYVDCTKMPTLLPHTDHPYWFRLLTLLVFAHKNDGHKKAPSD